MFSGTRMLNIEYFVKTKIMNGVMYVMCSVLNFCCLGGIFGLFRSVGNRRKHWNYISFYGSM